MSASTPHPDAQLLEQPQPGDACIFKYRGEWVAGFVARNGSLAGLRLPVNRRNDRRSRIYWRSRSQLFQPGLTP